MTVKRDYHFYNRFDVLSNRDVLEDLTHFSVNNGTSNNCSQNDVVLKRVTNEATVHQIAARSTLH